MCGVLDNAWRIHGIRIKKGFSISLISFHHNALYGDTHKAYAMKHVSHSYAISIGFNAGENPNRDCGDLAQIQFLTCFRYTAVMYCVP
jgi:hypothetical protein